MVVSQSLDDLRERERGDCVGEFCGVFWFCTAFQDFVHLICEG